MYNAVRCLHLVVRIWLEELNPNQKLTMVDDHMQYTHLGFIQALVPRFDKERAFTKSIEGNNIGAIYVNI